MKRYDVVFLDADGTLFDFRRAEDFALEGSFGEAGLDLTNEAARSYDRINSELWKRLERGEIDQGRLRAERFRLLFLELGIEADAGGFAETYVRWLSRGSFLIEGAVEACEYLSRSYVLSIVTNGIREVQLARIAASPLRPYLRDIVVSEEAGCGKPDPRFLEFACSRIGFHDKSRMIIVGDSLSSDIAGGLAFGIDTCWANLDGASNDSGLKPAFEISRLSELSLIL
jgi:YjjG family noncanonical pyrimidine nucleotidase